MELYGRYIFFRGLACCVNIAWHNGFPASYSLCRFGGFQMSDFNLFLTRSAARDRARSLAEATCPFIDRQSLRAPPIYASVDPPMAKIDAGRLRRLGWRKSWPSRACLLCAGNHNAFRMTAGSFDASRPTACSASISLARGRAPRRQSDLLENPANLNGPFSERSSGVWLPLPMKTACSCQGHWNSSPRMWRVTRRLGVSNLRGSFRCWWSPERGGRRPSRWCAARHRRATMSSFWKPFPLSPRRTIFLGRLANSGCFSHSCRSPWRR